MSEDASTLVARMRREFDAAFAEARETTVPDHTDLLCLAVGERRLALVTTELTEVMKCPPLTALPGGNRALSGLAGIRNSLVAVYDLGALLDHGEVPREGGWVAGVARDRTAAVRFDEIVSYERVALEEIRTAATSGDRPSERLVQIAGESYFVIDVAALFQNSNRVDRRE